MALSEAELVRVAELAKLSITDSDMQEVSEKLNKTLEMIGQLNQLDSRDIQPMSHPADTHQPLREDVVSMMQPDEKQAQRDTFQSLAPVSKHGLYLVPQVIDSE